MKWKQYGRLLQMLACMLAAGVCYSCGGKSAETVLTGEEAAKSQVSEVSQAVPELCEDEPEEDERGEASEAAETAAEEDPGPELVVHVCGSVAAPGVYELEAGSRIWQAVEAAGGMNEEADGDFLNLAAELTDGMRLEVPSREQAARWRQEGRGPEAALTAVQGAALPAAAGISNSQEASLVNLNTASQEELMTLRGIGEARAADIIRYRETFGPFRVIEDIMNVSGIKESAFEKIRDRITV